jgi:hypothetical protein
MSKRFILIALFVFAIMLPALACGGGGGSDDKPSTTAPTATPMGWVADSNEDGEIDLTDAGTTTGEKAEEAATLLETIYNAACAVQGGCEEDGGK